MLGGRYLNIYEGSHGTPEIAQGAVVQGVPPVDLIDEATKATQIDQEGLEEGRIIENLKATMAEINEITAKLSRARGRSASCWRTTRCTTICRRSRRT